MEASQSTNKLSADKPLVDPKDDLFGYSSFARNLTDMIKKMAPTEGFVVGIYGPWGSGKTTLTNFITYYVGQIPKEERPIVVPFNPWWFSGHEGLINHFFDQLQIPLRKSIFISKDQVEILSDFAELISEIPLPYASVINIFAKILKIFRPKKDVNELKKKIEIILQKQKKKILVIIDDIDRLTSEEIRQLFRVIKAVADFPNIIYLLAFDKKVAIEALKEMQGISGEDYLGKIVQVPLELPSIDGIELNNYFFKKLDSILNGTPINLFDKTDWGNVFLEGIKHFLKTPRSINRFINTLSVSYPPVKGEVNSVDFIAIETIKVFCPEVYNVIRNNPEQFAGNTDSFDGQEKLKYYRDFHDNWLNLIQEEDKTAIKRLLRRIFPKLEKVWGGAGYGVSWEATWRKGLHICSQDIFPIYFRYALPEGSLSNKEVMNIIGLASDQRTFSKKLMELADHIRPDGTTMVGALLERLTDYTEKEIQVSSIPSIINSLLSAGDQLIRPEDAEPRLMGFSYGNDLKIMHIILRLLERQSLKERSSTLIEAISRSNAIYITSKLVMSLGKQHGKYEGRMKPDDEKLIGEEELSILENNVLKKIRDSAMDGSLIDNPNLAYILFRWINWADGEEPRAWVQKITKDDVGLVKLLKIFLQKSYSQTISDVVGKTNYRIDLTSLEHFIDPSTIINRARNLLNDSCLSDQQGLAIQQFISEFSHKEQGKSVNDISDGEN